MGGNQQTTKNVLDQSQTSYRHNQENYEIKIKGHHSI